MTTLFNYHYYNYIGPNNVDLFRSSRVCANYCELNNVDYLYSVQKTVFDLWKYNYYYYKYLVQHNDMYPTEYFDIEEYFSY